MNSTRFSFLANRREATVCLLWMLVLPLAVAVSRGEAGTLVIENARIVVGNGDVKDGATVVIRGERIQSVSDQRPTAYADQRIDARNKTLMPGLIDSHVHIMSLMGRNRDEKAVREHFANKVPDNLKKYLHHGVTTVKSVGDPEDLILELRERLNKGEMAGPRLQVAGPIFTAVEGFPLMLICERDQWCRSQLLVEVDDEDAAREAVRRLATKRVDAIKVVCQGPIAGGKFPQISKSVVRAIIDEAHRNGLRVTIHTWREQDAIDAVESGADGLEHGVPTAILTDNRLAGMLRGAKASYAPTLRALTLQAGAGGPVAAKRNLKRLSDNGVRIVLGSDTFGNFPPGLNTILEMGLMAEAGLATDKIIRAGTRDAAEHLGLLADLGTIEPGKIADLIIVDGDPLKDISALHKVQVVIQAGRIVHDAETK